MRLDKEPKFQKGDNIEPESVHQRHSLANFDFSCALGPLLVVCARDYHCSFGRSLF